VTVSRARTPTTNDAQAGPGSQGVRARIERGDYADGQHLIQEKLPAECGVNRDVVWYALARLRKEGFTSLVSGRYVVDATNLSRQLVLSRLDDVEHVARRAARW
jgi:DNA-binding GntR family transcriptional regulator